MTKHKFYQMVDDSIVFFSGDSNEAFCEIDARLKDLFTGAKFYNPSDDTIQSAENVCADSEISETTGSHFLVVKANLSQVPVDLVVKFIKNDVSLHYIDGRFVHVEEYEFFLHGGFGCKLLLPGATQGIDFAEYVLKNL